MRVLVLLCASFGWVQSYQKKKQGERITTDLFSYKGKEFLITVDYYSNFWEEEGTWIYLLKICRFAKDRQRESGGCGQNSKAVTEEISLYSGIAWLPQYILSRNKHQPSSVPYEQTNQDFAFFNRNTVETVSTTYRGTAMPSAPKQLKQAQYYKKTAKEVTTLANHDVVHIKAIKSHECIWCKVTVTRKVDDRLTLLTHLKVGFTATTAFTWARPKRLLCLNQLKQWL